MELSREQSEAYLIRAWEAGRIRIGERWVHGHVIVAPDRVITDWNVDEPLHLQLADLEPAVALRPEIVLVGSGRELLLPDITLMAALAEHGVGLEFMSTPAACRTYNVLVHEQRRVVAALYNPAFNPADRSTS